MWAVDYVKNSGKGKWGIRWERLVGWVDKSED